MRRVLLVLVVLVSSDCASLKSLARASNDPTLRRVLAVAPVPPEVRSKIQLYQKYSAKYLKFTDSGELDSSDVLDVLKDSGVIPGAPSVRPRAGRGTVSRVPPPVSNYAGGYRWPTDAGVISSEYGARWGKKHDGIDVAADIGEPVKSSASGVVIYSGSGLRGYGNVMIVRHDEHMTTLYGHNSKLLAAVGTQVAGGQTIALLGNSGRSTGPHVHFEIRKGDQHINPRERLGSPPF